jgi:anti-anti-sigma regulatory factor
MRLLGFHRGCGDLARGRQRAAEEGRRLVLCCAEDQVERLLSVMGLTAEDGFVFPTLDHAIAAIG